MYPSSPVQVCSRKDKKSEGEPELPFCIESLDKPILGKHSKVLTPTELSLIYTMETFNLKGVFAKNESGYRLNAIKKKNNMASIQIEKIATYDFNHKKINLISNKSFRYYKL